MFHESVAHCAFCDIQVQIAVDNLQEQRYQLKKLEYIFIQILFSELLHLKTLLCYLHYMYVFCRL